MSTELDESIEQLRYHTYRLRAQRLKIPLPGSLLKPTIRCCWTMNLKGNDVLLVVGLEFAEDRHRLTLFSTIEHRIIVGPTWVDDVTGDDDRFGMFFQKIQ